MEKVSLIKTLNSRSSVKSSKLIKLDWLPGFTCQRNIASGQKSRWAGEIFFLSKNSDVEIDAESQNSWVFMLFLKIFYSVVQEPTADRAEKHSLN